MPTIAVYVPKLVFVGRDVRGESKVHGRVGWRLDRRHCGIFYDLLGCRRHLRRDQSRRCWGIQQGLVLYW